jgi:hypothetical protein
MSVSITVYGKVVSIESTGPPQLDLPPEAPEAPAPELQEALRAMRDTMPGYYRTRVVSPVEPREGEDEPKLWVHVHIQLDAPHVGELQVNAPESQVSGMLMVDGRARVTLSSN